MTDSTIPADLAFRLAELAVVDASRSFSMLRALAEWTVCLWLCARAASDAPHPPETCTDAGRLAARARAEIDGLRQPERAFIRFVEDRTRHFDGAMTGRRYRKATAEALAAKGVLEAFGAYAVDDNDNLTDRFGIAYRFTDLGREVARLLKGGA